jgi:hypothetical protein
LRAFLIARRFDMELCAKLLITVSEQGRAEATVKRAASFNDCILTEGATTGKSSKFDAINVFF